MKRTIVITSLIGLVVAVICYLSVVSQPTLPARFDHEKFVAAVHAYAKELRQQGVAVPERVALDVLIRRGFLNSNDVSAFQGMHVAVSIAGADETRRQSVLVRARMADGTEIVALGDGSVQHLKR